MYYVFGLDGMLYLVFNNEDETWEWMEANYGKWIRIACCGGVYNGVQLVSFEQDFGL